MSEILDISTVQAFVLVAELQSFTRAAEALGTTQAAVSMKLQRLEAVVGKRLVERSPRTVRLTAACVVPSASAARVKLCSSATSRKACTVEMSSAVILSSVFVIIDIDLDKIPK